jgi:toxin ParE1/3/4
MAAWRLTKIAALDLVDILTGGIEQFGKAQVRKYRKSLEGTFDTLASAPLLGREHAGAIVPVHVHFHKAHVVVYVIEAPGIVILRLLPALADWRESL